MYKDRTVPAGQKKSASYINVYRFDDINTLMDACSRLSNVNTATNTTANRIAQTSLITIYLTDIISASVTSPVIRS